MLFPDRALAQRLETTAALGVVEQTHVLRQLAPESGAQVQPLADGYAVAMGAAFPVNRAVNLGMSGPVSTADLDRMEAFFRSIGVPAQVDLCPFADSSLADFLGRRGYRIVQFFNVHIRAVTPDDARPAPPSDVRIFVADTPDVWTRTVASGFSGRSDISSNDQALARAAFERPDVRCFLAQIGTEIAGAGALAVRDGVGTLFSTSTQPAFRRRGVQMALMQARIAVAAELGCDLMTVQTSPPGNASQRNVQRAGFRIAYTKPILMREWS